MARIAAVHKSAFTLPCPACRSGEIKPGRLAWIAKRERDETYCCSELCAKRVEKHGRRMKA